jgi:hypothetical protein
MVAQSKIDFNNSTGDSAGFNRDGFKLGGGRMDPNYDIQDIRQISPLGGRQGGPGSIKFGPLKIPYAPGSFLDHLVEAYAGPHDFLNSLWSYHASGDYIPGASLFGRYLGSAATGFAETMTWVDVPLATPIVATSIVGLNSIVETSILGKSGP